MQVLDGGLLLDIQFCDGFALQLLVHEPFFIQMVDSRLEFIQFFLFYCPKIQSIIPTILHAPILYLMPIIPHLFMHPLYLTINKLISLVLPQLVILVPFFE